MSNPQSPAPQPPGPPSLPKAPTGGQPGTAPHAKPPAGGPGPDKTGAQRATRHFAIALIAMAFASMLSLPWSIGSLPLGALTLVLGIRAIVRSHRARVGSLTTAIVATGMAFALIVSIGQAGSLLLWSQQQARQDCLAQALTISARESCEKQFTQDVQVWQDSLLERARSVQG